MNRLFLLPALLLGLASTAQAAPKAALFGKHPHAKWVSVSPDGRWVLTGGDSDFQYGGDIRARVWDSKSGRQIGTIPDPEGDGDNVWLPDGRVAFPFGTPDDFSKVAGQEFAKPPVIGIQKISGGTPLVLRDFITKGDELFEYRASSDGRKLTVLSYYFIRHFDTHSGKLVKKIAWKYDRRNEMRRGVFARPRLSPDGRFLLTLDDRPSVYDTTTSKRLRRYSGRIGFEWITSNIFALGRGRIVSEPYSAVSSEFYSLSSGKRLWSTRGGVAHESILTPGHHILYPRPQQWVWRDAATGRVLRRLKTPIGEDDVYALTPDERAIYVLKPNGNIWRQILPVGTGKY